MSKDSAVPQDEDKKRRKQERKLARKVAKLEASATDNGAGETTAEAEVTGAVPQQSSISDADTSSKKEKKKRKLQEQESDANAGEDAAESSERRKKKRKEESDTPEVVADTADGSEKKKKKKKRKAEESGISSASQPDVVMQLSGAAPASSPAEVQAFLKSNSIKIDSPDGPVTPLLSFDQLAVPEELRSCFSTFKQPSPIQACTWPPSLQGKDVVGIAETGSGKTLAFGIPALVKLITNKAALQSPGVSILVVAPTRELALQTHDTLSAIGKPFKIASVAVFGGVPKDPQVKMLAKSRKSKDSTTKIIVGTPGRILDLCNDGACDLSGVDYLVLDEADRMLDKGFENDIRNIISQAKQGAERQTLMFSATWPESVRRLASSFLRTPVRVTVGSEELTANSRVEQVVEVFDDSRSKDSRLMALLRKVAHKKQASPEESRILVFGLYKKETARLEETLRRQGYSVGALHGDMAQTKRMEALDAFRKGETNLLVATDVAARGLDIPNVGLVVNYSFPLTIEDYVHRIGRTGRGGKDGKSITYFTGDNHERSLAGEFSRMLRDSGYPCEVLSQKFPMTIKKKEHSVYGAFFRDDIPAPKAPTKIVFD